MVAESVEIELPPADLEASPPASEVTPPAPSTEEPPAPDTGAEPPAPIETPRTWTLSELDQKADKEGLTPDEVREQRRLQQAANDRWYNDQQQVANLKAQEEARAAALASLKTETQQKLRANRERMLESPNADLELYAEREQAILDDYDAKAGDVHLTPLRLSLANTVLSAYGDTAANRRAVNAMDVPALIREVVQRAHDYGRQVGPDDKHVVLLKAVLDSQIEAASKKAVDDYKAANPQAGVIPTNGAHGGPGGLTPESYEQKLRDNEVLSPSEIDAMTAKYLT